MSEKSVTVPPDLNKRLCAIAIETTNFIAERVKAEFPDEGDFVPAMMVVVKILSDATFEAFRERCGMTKEELHVIVGEATIV